MADNLLAFFKSEYKHPKSALYGPYKSDYYKHRPANDKIISLSEYVQQKKILDDNRLFFGMFR